MSLAAALASPSLTAATSSVLASPVGPALLGAAAGSGTVEHGLVGVTGWVADIMVALGAPGVAVATLLETVFPPVPSEVILPLAGFLAYQGALGLVPALVAATLGSFIGSQVLYELARALGQKRSVRLLARMPLVDADDADQATAWFRRHGRGAVFFGRLVPGVRSLISLPAGASEMPRLQFVLYTVLGSLLWNALLISAGYALGSQYDRIADYVHYLDYVVYAAVAAVLVWLVLRWDRKRRRARLGATS